MLVTRLITAAVLASLVIGAIFSLPTPVTGFMFAVFVVLGAWEWTRLIGWQQPIWRVLYIVVTALLIFAIWRWNESANWFFYLQIGALAWWAIVFAFVLLMRGGYAVPRFERLFRSASAGWLVLLPAWSAVVWLLMNDPTMLLGLFLVVWVADGAAYFAGRKWGRRRLAPAISPGKTWAGVMGGVIFSVTCAFGFSLVVVLSVDARIGFLIVVLATVIASVIGDLFESVLKRQRGLKDSGTLLPGHGGVLDRIDGFVAAAPVFSSGLVFWVNRL